MTIFEKDFKLVFEDVLITPISAADAGRLADIAFDPDIWKFTTGVIANKGQLMAYVKAGVEEFTEKKRAAFSIFKSGTIAGGTSFGNVSVKDKRIEIGWTWIGKTFQGTGINSVCKFLLLQHAFEELKMERVEFKTDVLNLASRKALQKIGAVEEGVLRSHTLMHDNRRRETIYYSILSNEWAEVKKNAFSNLKNRTL